MSYLLLVIEKPEDRRDASADEGRRRYDRMHQFAGNLQAQGVLMGAESLALPTRGKRLMKRAGGTTLIDGPFAEAKEFVGGFFLLDCQTMDEAVAIADRCPAAEWSTVEVRQVASCFEDTE